MILGLPIFIYAAFLDSVTVAQEWHCLRPVLYTEANLCSPSLSFESLSRATFTCDWKVPRRTIFWRWMYWWNVSFSINIWRLLTTKVGFLWRMLQVAFNNKQQHYLNSWIGIWRFVGYAEWPNFSRYSSSRGYAVSDLQPWVRWLTNEDLGAL
jgi:hypothetical protein